MEVSRADISWDTVVEYPATERFLKLPVKKYLSLLGIEPAPPQIAIINAINCPKYRFIVAAISRRTGKTYIANIIAQLVALVPGCNVLIMSPNYSLSQISFELQRQLIRNFELEVARDNSKDKVIELTNGSTVRMGSVTQADSVVGRSYNFILFDEAALSSMGEQAFNINLRPTLDVTDANGREISKAIFISTPRGRNNWFAKFYERGFSDDYPSWVSIHATWHDNPRASEQDIKEAQIGMSTNEFRQEYLADFCVFEGQIWNFDTDECVKDLSEMSFNNYEIISGLDVGFRDPTAMAVIATDGEYFYVVDEYLNAGSTTAQQAHEVKRLEDKYGIDFIFIDSAAAQTKYDFAVEHDINCINATKSRLDGIAFVGNIIESGRLIVDQKCTHTLETLDQYRWDANPNLTIEKPIHDDYCHMADALRYAIYTHQANALSF